MKPKENRSTETHSDSRKRLKADDRRNQLLKVAKELFAKHGFENASTKAIAAAAGVTEAIIFRHFTSKQELYANILDRRADEIDINTWRAELDHYAKCEDDEALVLSVVKRILESDRLDPQFQRMLLQAALTGHPLREITRQRLLPLYRFLYRYIQKRQKKGAFQKCNAKLAAQSIVGMPSYHGLAQILFGIDFLSISEDEAARDFAQLILEGLRVPDTSSQKRGGKQAEESKED